MFEAVTVGTGSGSVAADLEESRETDAVVWIRV